MKRRKEEIKQASEIYAQQNKTLHMIFTALGQPYQHDKDWWLSFFENFFGREVQGLSDLTLGERDVLIKHFQYLYPDMEIYNPPVPKKLRGWKKGMPDAAFKIYRERDPQARMIFALWAELGYEPCQIRELLRRMFKVEAVRWLDEEQKRRLVNFLRHKLAEQDQDVHYWGDR